MRIGVYQKLFLSCHAIFSKPKVIFAMASQAIFKFLFIVLLFDTEPQNA